MAQPRDYTRQYNFNDYQATSPSDPLRGSEVDGELNAIKLTLDDLNANIAKIQRDDGKLGNTTVHKDAFDQAALAIINSTFKPRGNWSTATSYAVNDAVNFNGATYVATVAHTSSAAFATDTAASRWILIANAALSGTSSSVDKFEGDGSTTAFTLSNTYASETSFFVFVNGELLNPVDDYTLSGTTLTLYTAPGLPTVAGNENLIVWGSNVVAQASQDAAEAAESNASGYADESQSWASKTNGIVESTDYSSKAWSIGGTGVDTGSGSAKDWASKLGSTVGNTTEYSSKYWATQGNVPVVATNIASINTVAGISSDVTTVSGVNAAVTNLSGISAAVSTVSGISSSVSTVSGVSSDVTTVASNIGSVTTVATNIAKVITVANDLAEAISEVETVADDLNEAVSEIEVVAGAITNVDLVGGSISSVNTLAAINTAVSDVGAISANVTTVAGISANVSTVAGISSNVTTVAGINAEVTNLSGISGNITSVSGIASDVTAVSGINADVSTVSGISANVTTVSGISPDVTTVAGISGDVTSVSGISANVTTVAGISSNVTTVAGDTANIGTVATDLGGSDNIGTVAGSIANVNSVGGSIANVNTVATNLTSVNSFANLYRTGSSDPTTGLDEGDLFYNSASNTLKIYTGLAWEAGVTAGSGFLAQSSNLSDLDNASTARTNLGLVIGTDVQAFDANLPTFPSGISATEVSHLNGVTSNIQTQLNAAATTGKAIAMAIVFG